MWPSELAAAASTGHHGSLSPAALSRWLTDNGFAVAQHDGRLMPTAAAVDVGAYLG